MNRELTDHWWFKALGRNVRVSRLGTFSMNIRKRQWMRKGNAVCNQYIVTNAVFFIWLHGLGITIK